MIKKVHHVGVVVREIYQAMRFYRDTLGLRAGDVQTMEEQGVKAVLLALGDSEIELLEPVAPDTGVARFLERRGEGLHHVCLEVDDVERDLSALKEKDVELIDTRTRSGLAGRICFLHPLALDGTLVELCQPLDAQAAAG